MKLSSTLCRTGNAVLTSFSTGQYSAPALCQCRTLAFGSHTWHIAPGLPTIQNLLLATTEAAWRFTSLKLLSAQLLCPCQLHACLCTTCKHASKARSIRHSAGPSKQARRHAGTQAVARQHWHRSTGMSHTSCNTLPLPLLFRSLIRVVPESLDQQHISCPAPARPPTLSQLSTATCRYTRRASTAVAAVTDSPHTWAPGLE
jgi:hypothetical protein